MAVCWLLMSSVCMLSPRPPPPLPLLWLLPLSLPLLSLMLPVLLPVLLRCCMSGFFCPIPRSRNGKGDSSGSSCSIKVYRRTASQTLPVHYRSRPANKHHRNRRHVTTQKVNETVWGGGYHYGRKVETPGQQFSFRGVLDCGWLQGKLAIRDTPETLLPVHGHGQQTTNLWTTANSLRGEGGFWINHLLAKYVSVSR